MATYTVANGGGNINAAATYVGGVGVPGAADTIAFTNTSGQLTVNVATTIFDIDFSTYANVITFNADLTVTRNITFNTTTSTYTIAGTFSIVKNGTGTILSNGKVWTGKFTIGGTTNYTITFNDKLTVSGEVLFTGTGTVSISPNNILDPARLDITGNFTVSGSGILVPTVTNGFAVTFNGTGSQTWAGGSSTGQIRLDVIINKSSGTLTFTGNITYNTGLFTYTSGTTNTGTSTLIISTATTTMNTNGSTAGGATTTSSTGINWYRLTLSTTLNLTSNFTVINTLTANVGTITRSSTQNVYLGGSLTMTSTLTSTAAAIIMNGSGTWSGSGVVTAPLTFNSIGGTIIISGNVYFSTRTLTYTAADTIDTTNSTLNINDSCTLNTNGITWNNISAGLNFTNPTITLSSNLTWTGTMSLMNNQLVVNGATRTVTFSGVGALSPTLVANVSIGNYGYASFGGTTIVNFPASTVLSITNLTIGAGGANAVAYNCTVNNVTFNISGIFQVQTTNQNVSRFNGTSSQINMTGNSCTISQNIVGGGSPIYISIPVTINTSGTVTLSANNTTIVYFETTVTYTTGTISGSVTAVFVTCTLNLNAGGQWGTNVTIRGATTLTSNATFGNLTTDTTVVTFSGAFTINVKGNLAINTTTSGASTPIVLNGTGAQTWSHSSAVYLSNNLTINKASGTLTVSGNVYYVTGTLTYTASGGTVTTTGSTIVFNGTTTIATNGITWNNVQFAGASPTYTLSNNFTVGGTLTLNASGTETVNGSILYLASLSHTGALCQGTTTFTFYTTGTWSTGGANALRNPTIIDTSSNTLTIASQIRYDTGTLTYTSGTVDTTTNSSTIVFSANVTLATNGVTWYNFTINTASVLTLTNNFVWSNNFSIITAVVVSFAGVGNLAPTSTANLVLSAASTLTVKNNIQINNATLFGTINTNTISISGNLTNNGLTSGTSNLTLNGSGSQSWTGTANYLSNPVNISKSSGTLTLGSLLYYNGTLTYISGNVDSTTNNNTIYTTAANFNTSGTSLNNVYFLSAGGNVFTISSDLVMGGTFTCGGNGTITGAFNLYCGSFVLNNSSSGASVVTLTHSGIIYCSGDSTFASGLNTCTTTGTLYCSRNCTVGASTLVGATNLYMVGNGTLSTPSNSLSFNSNVYINCTGTITLTGSFPFSSRAVTFNLISGNVNAKSATLTLPAGNNHTLINMHRIVWGTVSVTTSPGAIPSLSMNQFFCGDASYKTVVSATTSTNFTVTFTDNLEKLSFYVKLRGVTITNRGQLTVLTNGGNNLNNIGVKFAPNQLPNSLPKNNPIISKSPQLGSFLLSEPIYN